MNEDQRKKYLIKFGNRIKELRLEKEMSQDELAKRCGYSSRSTINKIELGINDVPQSKIKAIAKALNVSVGTLLCLDEARSDCLKKFTTADRLKQIMDERGLKQVEVLEACKPYCEKYNVPLRKNDLSQYVSGKAEPKQDKLSILGLALDVNEVWLMGYDVPARRTALLQLQNEPINCENFEQCHDKGAFQAVKLFLRLDTLDQGRIIGSMETLLEQEKYSAQKGSPGGKAM